jgi:ATP-dependent RNA helicase DDX54/DBP10
VSHQICSAEYRLFEMGFDPQLREILHRLPSSRQSLLYSATLPSSVAEFAQAGLSNPALIRLDTEVKVSPDLSMAFFPVKFREKEAALLALLDRVLRSPGQSLSGRESSQAIIFVSTRHHVEYLATLLVTAGHRVAHIYGSLDQTARHRQLESFRKGEQALLVVTDVAARGLDIPVMENVINYDFPASSRIFVHRVGRTARAGRKGAAWSFIAPNDMPYFIDLEAFLGSRIIGSDQGSYALIPHDAIDEKAEYIVSSLEETQPQLAALRRVMLRGQAMFDRSRSKASSQAYRDAKAYSKLAGQGENLVPVHAAFPLADSGEEAEARGRLVSAVQTYKPNETVFEIGIRGQSPGAVLMKARRKSISRREQQPPKQTDSGSEMKSTLSLPIQVNTRFTIR